MAAADVIAAARACIDTPFHHQGRQPGVGLDCAGLLVHAFSAAGHRTIDDHRYPRAPDPRRMRSVLERILVRVTDAWRPGDVLYCRIKHDPQHLAIWTGSSMIHGYLTAGRVVEHGMDRRWERRVIARYRHPELIDE
ncbi:MAG: NlpC/P60 family protein [Halofilum sp. (in: g-proteobacteria)]